MNAAGANFVLLGPADTMVKSTKPVIDCWRCAYRMRQKPVYDESNLTELIKDLKVNDCVFSYSDVPYARVMALVPL